MTGPSHAWARAKAGAAIGWVVASAACCPPCGAAEEGPRLTLPAVFGDHMVVRREFPVFGTAAPGAEVTVFVAPEVGPDEIAIDVGRSTTADGGGRWRVDCAAPAGDGPIGVRVFAGEESVTFSDVLVGDVWVCSGQSNMEFPLGMSAGGGEAVAGADRGDVRLFKVERRLANGPDGGIRGAWRVCSPETARTFSAVGYYFAEALARERGRPVGLIQAAWGGTRIEAWTPPGSLGGGEASEYAEFSAGERLVAGSTPKTKRLKQTPAALWHGMIEPVVPYGVDGVLWYQGEANSGRPETYGRLQNVLITGFREAWGAPELPFLFTQLPGFEPRGEKRGRWAAMRTAQAESLALPATGMAVTIDVGEADDIHPRRKRPVGERLALLAREVAYGELDLVADPPAPVEVYRDGAAVRVRVGSAGGRLGTRRATEARSFVGFEVAGADRVFLPARASPGYANSLTVRAESVPEPAFVRYAWADSPEGANVVGGTGLPMGPFEAEVRARVPPEAPETGKLWLPAVFGDRMVVAETATFWGRAAPNASVQMEIFPLADLKRWRAAGRVGQALLEAPQGLGQCIVADTEGRWSRTFESLADLADADGRLVITVRSGEDELTFRDVLVGDVWLCSGQSNMEWSLDKLHRGDRREYGAFLDDHEGAEIRLFQVANAAANGGPAEDVRGEWVVCDADAAEQFSAVGYHFGTEVAAATGRPVGLIDATWGGTAAEPWVPAAALERAFDGAAVRTEYAAGETVIGTPTAKPPTPWAWRKRLPGMRSARKPQQRASSLFDGMIAPLVPLKLAGVVWYQGESNAGRAHEYGPLFRTLIGSWREAFGTPELPFLFVQLAGWDVPDRRSANGRWPELRAAQAAALSLPATGMAVTYDAGEVDDIHPQDKATVGRRLALQARKVAYREDVVADGPVPEEVTFENDTVRIEFANAAGGLRDDCPNGCGAVAGFELTGADGVWRAADATVVTTDTLEIDAFDVPEPTAVRYAWADFPGEANLYGGTGLPAWPFERAR